MRYKQQLVIFIVLLVSGALGLTLSLYRHPSETIKVDGVRTIETFHYPSLFVNQLRGDPRAGEKIFKEFCGTCHREKPMIDVRAPRIGDQAAWKTRRQLGLAILLNITVNGVGAMPARGGCFECSDEQLRETIRYILKNTP
jgi:cytochrome c5